MNTNETVRVGIESVKLGVEPIRVGIVGCGYWGINYVRVFSELTQATISMVSDQRDDRLQLLNRRFPGVSTTSDWTRILEDEETDAVIVATPATGHYEIVRNLLEHGKHVLVEKPMTTDVDEAQRLVDLAERKRLTLMVGHTFLYNCGIRKIRSLLQADDFGDVYYLYSTRTNLGPLRQDVSAIWDLAPHDISIFNYLVGEMPRWVSAVGARPLRNGREDVGFITMSYPSGILGHIHVSWADPQKVRQVVVVGSHRRVVFDDLNASEQVRVYEKGVAPASTEAGNFGEYSYLVRDGDVISPKVETSEPLKNQCSNFLDSIEGKAVALSDGRKGLEVAQIMSSVEKSLRNNGAPTPV